MKIGIRNKLLLGFALLVGLSFISQFILFTAVDKYTRNQIDNLHLERAKEAGREIQSFLDTIGHRSLEFTTLFSQDTTPNKDKFAEFAKVIIASNDHIENISFLAPSGREIIRFDRQGRVPDEELSIDLPTKEFEEALKGNITFSKVFYLDDSLSPYADMYFPLGKAEGSNDLGVAKVLVDLNELWSVIAEAQYGSSGFAYVVDGQGIVIAHPQKDLLIERKDLSDRPAVSSLMKQSFNNLSPTVHLSSHSKNNNTSSDSHTDSGQILSGIDSIYINEKNVRVTAQGIFIPGPNWFIIFEHNLAEAYEFPTFIRNVFIISITGSLFLLLLIAALVSNNLTNPILKLKEATSLLTKGKLSTRISIKSHDELEELGSSFNAMASNLQDVVSRLEQDKNILSAERNKIAIALSSITDGIIAVDLERKIIIFNKAAEKITGYTFEEVNGKHIDEILSFKNQEGQIQSATYCPIRTDDFEGVVYSSENIDLISKKESYIDLTVGKIKEGRHVNLGCILALHDKTREKELEEMKLDFVSMAAHELRTPLTSIRGYLSVFLEEEIPLSTEQKMFLQRISIASNQLVTLVENLLNITKIEKGAMALSKRPINILEAVTTIVDSLSEPANQKQITVTIDSPTSTLSPVNVDAFRISEVITNLVSNAINYTNSNGSVAISFEQNEDELITHIKDTGQGIPKEALPHLFTKFYRVSGKLEQGSKGTGLGLYISKAIIEMHGGRIWVESELNKGSTFSFALPFK